MPYSQKQLDERYKSVCENIKDAKEYTMEHLKSTIEMNVVAFFDNLGKNSLFESSAELDAIEETIHQCRVAITNEKSRRILQDEFTRMARKYDEKTIKKHHFKMKRRQNNLEKASPYPVQSPASIGH